MDSAQGRHRKKLKINNNKGRGENRYSEVILNNNAKARWVLFPGIQKRTKTKT